MSDEKKKISIVVPVFNESEVIDHFYNAIVDAMNEASNEQALIDELSAAFEVHEEHVLDAALLFYIRR